MHKEAIYSLNNSRLDVILYINININPNYLSRCALINFRMEILLSSPYHTIHMLLYNITIYVEDLYFGTKNGIISSIFTLISAY